MLDIGGGCTLTCTPHIQHVQEDKDCTRAYQRFLARGGRAGRQGRQAGRGGRLGRVRRQQGRVVDQVGWRVGLDRRRPETGWLERN